MYTMDEAAVVRDITGRVGRADRRRGGAGAHADAGGADEAAEVEHLFDLVDLLATIRSDEAMAEYVYAIAPGWDGTIETLLLGGRVTTAFTRFELESRGAGRRVRRPSRCRQKPGCPRRSAEPAAGASWRTAVTGDAPQAPGLQSSRPMRASQSPGRRPRPASAGRARRPTGGRALARRPLDHALTKARPRSTSSWPTLRPKSPAKACSPLPSSIR